MSGLAFLSLALLLIGAAVLLDSDPPSDPDRTKDE
jgi:hypothetical protein